MAAPAKILDRSRAEARARLGDVIAFGVVLIIGAALLFDMYSLGYSAAEAATGAAGTTVLNRDKQFARTIIQAVITAFGLAWIAFRLFVSSVKRSGG